MVNGMEAVKDQRELEGHGRKELVYCVFKEVT